MINNSTLKLNITSFLYITIANEVDLGAHKRFLIIVTRAVYKAVIYKTRITMVTQYDDMTIF